MAIKIVGAGSLAREVHAALTAMGHVVECFLVEQGFESPPVCGIPVRPDLASAWEDTETQFVLAVGDNIARARIAAKFRSAKFMRIRHPAAMIGPGVVIGEGTMIIGPASVTTDIEIGAHVLINPGCNISHDCRLGSFVSLGPGTSLAGRVTLEQGASLGVGAVVAPDCVVGEWAVVGAGAVVIRDVEPRTTVVGIAAQPIVRQARGLGCRHGRVQCQLVSLLAMQHITNRH